MVEAKLRGTREQRIAQAIQREEESRAKRTAALKAAREEAVKSYGAKVEFKKS